MHVGAGGRDNKPLSLDELSEVLEVERLSEGCGEETVCIEVIHQSDGSVLLVLEEKNAANRKIEGVCVDRCGCDKSSSAVFNVNGRLLILKFVFKGPYEASCIFVEEVLDASLCEPFVTEW